LTWQNIDNNRRRRGNIVGYSRDLAYSMAEATIVSISTSSLRKE
jgi:hypothetical protein